MTTLGLIDLGTRGLVATGLARRGLEVRVLEKDDESVAALEDGSLSALVVESERLDARARGIVAAASGHRVPVLVVCREREVEAAVAALRAGASDYLCSPFDYDALCLAIDRLLRRAEAQAETAAPPEPLVTRDPAMREALALAESVAPSDATVLIEGESGTGKELLARFIHESSPRRSRELFTLNCASIPPGLIESELFGHERGAFTGAFRRVIGKFQLADRSTLLLDEISELEMALQAKLLRVLQEREVQPLGAARPRPVDCRIVATTNRDLVEEVQAGRFRQDLFYRLHVVPIRLAPLRERAGDVTLLVEHFLRRHASRGWRVPQIDDAALGALEAHDWPGNVRELENLMERLVLTRPGQKVGPEDLEIRRGVPLSSTGSFLVSPPAVRTLREMERWMITDTLRRLRGNRTHAARELGIGLRTLRNKIREYGIFEPETLPRTGTVRPPFGGEGTEPRERDQRGVD